MLRGEWRGFLGLALMTAAMTTACGASSTPLVIPSDFAPPWNAGWHPDDKAAAGTCHVRIGAVSDARADTTAMGSVGGRPIRAADGAAWIRSALKSLARDKRLVVDGAPDASDIVLGAELLKAYAINITTDKSASIVVRVRYARAGAPDAAAVFRGADTDVNWFNGDEEITNQFNRALAQLVASVDRDLTERCTQPVATAAPATATAAAPIAAKP